MDFKAIGETLAVAVTAGTATGWLFREKITAWVRKQTSEQRKDFEARLTRLEKDHTKHEGDLMRVAESLERTSENFENAVKRMTTAMERIADGHEEMRSQQQKTAEIAARVDERTRALMELRQEHR